MNRPKPKIFLSYAHEDIGMAKELFSDLKRYGLDVWIDCESLLPGQNWKITIEKTIKQSQYYVLLLSSHSISKRGFIQKEMKIANEMLEQCSEDDIYLIPVRLNECAPSLKLSDIHYIDVFPEGEYQNGLKKILQVVSPGTFIIRKQPKELSSVETNEMLKKHGYYDSDRNPDGKGIEYYYLLKEIMGDKIVYDEVTKLIWQQSGSSKAMYFDDAKHWVEELKRKGFAGFNDWRLPTLEEAMSLVKPERKNNLYIDSIFDNNQRYIWTVDKVKEDFASWEWVVLFSIGSCSNLLLIPSGYYVRAVRSGQSSGE